MTNQTSYSERMGLPEPGTLAGNVDSARTTTGIAETAAPGIPFGRAISQGTLSDQGVILGGSLASLRGVSIRDITLRGDVSAANLDKYQPTNSVGVMESGDIWVEPAGAVAAHAAVYFSATTGIFDDAAGGNVGPIPGAYWKTSCDEGGRAIVAIPQGGRAA
jgi:hypothetical protein